MSSIMKKLVMALFLTVSSVSYGVAGPQVPDLSLPDEGVTISMDLQNASLKDVLKLFSIQSGLNFIANEGVQERTITLYLDKVPLREAMDKLFSANNLSFDLAKDSNVIIVKDWGKPAVETITKVFKLRYATVSTSSMKEEMQKQIKDVITMEAKGVKTGSSSSGSADNSKWKSEDSAGVTSAVTKLLSDLGSVIEDYRTNSLIVTDIPSRMEVIEKVIADLDVEVPEVLIEVEILDVSKNTLERKGVKFGDITSYPSLLNVTYTGASRAIGFPFNIDGLAPKGSGFTDSSAANALGAGSVTTGGYNVLLDFIKSIQDTKILARPRILTLNNEPAEISNLVNEIIGFTRTVEDDGSVTVTAERADVGISLRVVPQVNLNTNEITMFVSPMVVNSAPSELISSSGDQFRNPEGRQTKSMVRIKDGETIILGGLIDNHSTLTTTKVPVLSDVPLVGRFFRHSNRDNGRERELLVFITPHIVRGSAESVPQGRQAGRLSVSNREQGSVNGIDRQAVISSSLTGFEVNQ